MPSQGMFSGSRSVYWPGEFTDLVNMLKGLDHTGKPAHHAMYRYNTGPIVLAAILGLAHKRERDVGTQRQEISTDTFEAHRFGNATLSSYIMLIPLIGTRDVDLLRPEREEELIRTFERYAAGGLEYLRGALSRSPDPSGLSVIRAEVERALGSKPMSLTTLHEEELQI